MRAAKSDSVSRQEVLADGWLKREIAEAKRIMALFEPMTCTPTRQMAEEE